MPFAFALSLFLGQAGDTKPLLTHFDSHFSLFLSSPLQLYRKELIELLRFGVKIIQNVVTLFFTTTKSIDEDNGTVPCHFMVWHRPRRRYAKGDLVRFKRRTPFPVFPKVDLVSDVVRSSAEGLAGRPSHLVVNLDCRDKMT